MNFPVISVNNVSKHFRVAGKSSQSADQSIFWALKDISFDVAQGEILGIIGKNGSGKSTLLKILSNIIRPSSGSVSIRGTATSILEIGSGFHPDLTGRENIYFYGTFLGINNEKMNYLYEEIIDFSEIGKFANEPVKNYSNGMYLRLALSVVLHTRISTLIIDEVLSAGDAGFRRKIFERIRTHFKERGITVVLVSHGMNDLMQLCSRCIYLDKGEIKDIGEPNEIIARYLLESTTSDQHKSQFLSTVNRQVWNEPVSAPGNEHVRLIGVRISHNRKDGSPDIFIEDEINIEVDFMKLTVNKTLYVILVFYDALQTPLFFATSLLNEANENIEDFYRNGTGQLKYTCHIPSVFNAGHYSFQVKFGQDKETEIYIHNELFDFIIKKNPHLNYYDIKPVTLRPIFLWKHQKQI